MMDDATKNQIASADPLRSTWLTANAGSGKTRVLTDRVARLLLAGTAPGRILCLTYTKAAATEMQNRLLKRLGEWAMLPEPALLKALADLGEHNAPDLAEARRLFARAIETPGGLKVQTIHSFCASLLRRFPLEAGVPMGFAELDDRSGRALRSEIIEEMAEADDPTIRDLTFLHTGVDLDRFLLGLNEADFENAPDIDAIWTALGLPSGFDEAALLREVFSGEEVELIASLLPLMRTSNQTDQGIAALWSAQDWSVPNANALAALEDKLLYKTKDKLGLAKLDKVLAVGLQRGAAAQYMAVLNDLMLRVQDARQAGLALGIAKKTLALHRFGHAFTRRFAERKAAHGWLDFDDLIRRTAQLLNNSSMAQWVLWRLDGGIDHILVDEAQDTSPEQWKVIRSLTEEFTSGAAIQDRPRTLFVVGDPKQSIYSFQGADIAVFEEMREQFSADFQAVQSPMQQKELAHSFRSSPAILSFVDAVFQAEAAKGLGGQPHHIPFFSGAPGRVDIWPPLPEPEKPEPGDWTDPVDTPAENAANTLLARAVAQQIKAIIGTPFTDPRTSQVRAIGPGDIQILVQRRSTLFSDLIRECKTADLPVAGADRLKLAAELAVRDIVATLSVLATPEDSLSLAAALRSPLFGLSEDDLYRLAKSAGKRPLWSGMLDSPHKTARDILLDLMAQADFFRPYDLISRLLTRHGGRTALLARLGSEAEDGINELLSQALTYETTETPSLTGFLVWLSSDDVEIKRQLPGGAGGLIRIMTVHGSKGLESPVVILPETQIRKANNSNRTTQLADMPAWRGSADERPEPLAEAVQEHSERQEDEKRRLLYVAMTRAESWLIVAAAGKTGEGLESWHSMIIEGAERIGDTLRQQKIEINGVGTGLRLSFGDWPVGERKVVQGDTTAPPLPDWAKRPAPPIIRPPMPVAATLLGGAKVVGAPVENADPAAGMLRGTRLHLLMEHLPGTPPDQWPELARTAFAGAEGGLVDEVELEALLAEAGEVINAPELADIMTPSPDATILREVSLTAKLDRIGVLHGTIDRLIVDKHRVLAIDYKSNAQVPATPKETPLGISRQMAAYRAALREIYPNHRIETGILWTATRSLMELPDEFLDDVMAGLDQSALRS